MGHNGVWVVFFGGDGGGEWLTVVLVTGRGSNREGRRDRDVTVLMDFGRGRRGNGLWLGSEVNRGR